jgi:hypothetical protein
MGKTQGHVIRIGRIVVGVGRISKGINEFSLANLFD